MNKNTAAIVAPARILRGRALYTPTGRAGEYVGEHDLACNPYLGCGHLCRYCYNRYRKNSVPEDRAGDFLGNISDDLRRLDSEGVPPNNIFLSFLTDAYQPLDVTHGVTRNVIQMVHAAGRHVTVLTKGGARALRDIDLFGSGDQMAAMLTFDNDTDSLEWEPGAALPEERLDVLRQFHERGVYTWVSIEPVIVPAQSLAMIERARPVTDSFKIGRWNYDARASAIDWRAFYIAATGLLDAAGKPYYIKHDLRKAAGAEAAK